MIDRLSIAILLASILISCSGSEDTKFTSMFCRGALDCTKYSRDVRFVVSMEKNLVVTKFYDKGKVITTDFLKDCTILDAENWECTHINISPSYSYRIKRTGNFIETTDANIKFEKTK